MTFEQRLEGDKGVSQVESWRKNILGKRNSQMQKLKGKSMPGVYEERKSMWGSTLEGTTEATGLTDHGKGHCVFFHKRVDSKYFKLRRPHKISVADSSLLFKPIL